MIVMLAQINMNKTISDQVFSGCLSFLLLHFDFDNVSDEVRINQTMLIPEMR